MNRAFATPLVLAVVVALGAAVPAAAQSRVETRTIELRHLRPAEAVKLLEPYIVNADGGVFDVSETIPIVTIRDVPENLDRMEKVLAKYDHSPATVRFVFQLIEADTGNRFVTASNAQGQVPIELDSTLRSVLRFPVYRLAAQGVSATGEYSRLRQQLGSAGNDMVYVLRADVGPIKVRDGGAGAEGTVNLTVSLARQGGGPPRPVGEAPPSEEILATGLDVPLGNTVVLGTAATRINGVALILVVRPELVAAK